MKAYHGTWTDSVIAGKRAEADDVLEGYSEEVIRLERPKIVEDALRGNLWKTIGANILSAFFYTLLLIGGVIVLQRSGVDILDIAEAGRARGAIEDGSTGN